MTEVNEVKNETQPEKKGSIMGWIVSAITTVILLFSLWMGKSVSEVEVPIDNQIYLVSQTVEPGVKDIVDEIKKCNFNEKDVCNFHHYIEVKVRKKVSTMKQEEQPKVEEAPVVEEQPKVEEETPVVEEVSPETVSEKEDSSTEEVKEIVE